MDIHTKLFSFARDVQTMQEVEAYLDIYIKDKIIERVFLKQDAKDLAEAKQIMDGFFAKLRNEAGANEPGKFINESE